LLKLQNVKHFAGDVFKWAKNQRDAKKKKKYKKSWCEKNKYNVNRKNKVIM